MVTKLVHWKFETIYYGFQGLFPNMFPNFKDDGLDPIRYNIVYLIILFYLSPLINLILAQCLSTSTSWSHIGSLKKKPWNLYWLNLVVWSLMNLFKPRTYTTSGLTWRFSTYKVWVDLIIIWHLATLKQ